MAEPTPVAVSYVVPILNEERYVRATVASILAQQDVAEYEVLLVRGRSTDGTDAIIDELAVAHSQIRVIENPRNGISIAMNLGFEAAAYDVVVRVDGHSELPPDYTARTVAALRESGAVNVGGRMHAEGLTAFQEAVAWAYNSKAGLGGGIYHLGGEPGPADSAYLGVFDRNAVLAVGGFDEDLSRGEDWELNYRLRKAGGVVWFVPGVEVVYRPRATPRHLARQFHASGRWRGELIRRFPGNVGLRYLVPPLFVVGLGMSVLFAVLAAVVGGPAAVTLGVLAAIPAITYVAWLVIAIAGASAMGGAARLRLAGVIPIMHLSWGAGCLLGLLRPSRGLNAFPGR